MNAILNWLLKDSRIEKYLKSNFKTSEWKKAVSLTCMIGIATVDHVYGNKSSKVTMNDLTSILTSNKNAIAQFPNLNRYLKDIQSELRNIKQGLNNPNSKKSMIVSIPRPKTEPLKSEKKKATKPKRKQMTHAKYPNWWPSEDHETSGKDEPCNDEKNELLSNDETNETNNNEKKINMTAKTPQINGEPIAFSIPKNQFSNENQQVHLHVNLYPEYMKNSVDSIKYKHENMYHSQEDESKNFMKQTESRKSKINKKKKKKQKRSRSTTPHMNSHSKTISLVNPNAIPCLKYKKIDHNIKKKQKQKIPSYLRNVESKIKNDIIKHKRLSKIAKNEAKVVIENILKSGYDDCADFYDELYDRYQKRKNVLNETKEEVEYEKKNDDSKKVEEKDDSILDFSQNTMKFNVGKECGSDDSILSGLREWLSDMKQSDVVS